MTDTVTAMLRTVLAFPADDTPRWVYADALDDTGDAASAARAEFVRLQLRAGEVAQAIGTLGHPPTDWCDCVRCRCERRAVLLFDRWGAGWSPWAVLGSGDVRNWRRGFHTVATGSMGTMLTKLPGLIASAPVETAKPTDVRPYRRVPSSDRFCFFHARAIGRVPFATLTPGVFRRLKGYRNVSGEEVSNQVRWYDGEATAWASLSAALVELAAKKAQVPAC